jgi:hypothetical protein
MVIRSIRQHVTTHNWFAVTIDVLIVFVGVFLGIQANNWNEARIADKTAQSNRERLIEDLRTNDIDFEGRRSYYGDVREHALLALEGFSTPSAAGEEFLVHSYQATQVVLRPLRRFTYDELLASGELASIGDQKVRELAAAYYLGMSAQNASLEQIPPYRDRLRREMPYAVQQRIQSRCGDRIRNVKGAVIRSLPKSCDTGLDRAVIAKAVAQLRSAPEMDRDLTRYLVDIDQRLNSYRAIQRRLRELRDALAKVDA